MKKRILSILLAAVMVLSLLPVTALAVDLPLDATDWVVDEGDNHVWYKLEDTNGDSKDDKLTIGGEGAMPDYPTFTGQPWGNLGNSLTTVNIESGVTHIGVGAFYMFTALTSVTFAEGSQLTTIGKDAFQGCTSLSAINLNNAAALQSIGENAFLNCRGLMGVTIPASVTSIGFMAFSECSALTSVTFAGTSQLTTIGISAFAGCSALTGINIPASVTSIGDAAFDECYALAGITVDGNNTKYCSENGALFNKDKTELLLYPAAKTGTTSYEIPGTVTTIGRYAFDKSLLSSITLPAGLTTIGFGAFCSCAALTSVTIPSGVTSIGGTAFAGCSTLATVTVQATTPPTLGNDYVFENCNALAKIYVPAESVNTYKTAWSAHEGKIVGYGVGAKIRDGIVFEPWDKTDSLPDTAGSYYLTEDVTLDATWDVPAGTTNLDLNGHVIKANCTAAVEFNAITLDGVATLNLYDCGTIEHAGYVDAKGLWHLGEGEGTPKTITGGIITGGNNTGGGVYVKSNGIFTMNGGNIAGNKTAISGGGVHAAGNASFTMNGGSIVGNTATNGGGVYVTGDATFTMNGGSVVGNTATNGGVCVNSNNVTLGGTAQITGNTNGNGTANNLYLRKNKTIATDGEVFPADGMLVGVTMQTPGKVGGDTGYVKYFVSDDPGYVAAADGSDYIALFKLENGTVAVNLDTARQYTSLCEAIDNARASDTIRLFADVTENIFVSKELTLDFKGHVLTGAGEDSVIKIGETGDLTLIDGNPTAKHDGYLDENGLWKPDSSDEHNGQPDEYDLLGGIITGGTGYYEYGGTYGGGVYNNGTLTMNGGNIAGNTATDGGGGIESYGSIEMNGGSIVGNTTYYHGGGVESYYYLKVNGGSIVGNTAAA